MGDGQRLASVKRLQIFGLGLRSVGLCFVNYAEGDSTSPAVPAGQILETNLAGTDRTLAGHVAPAKPSTARSSSASLGPSTELA